VRFSLSEPQSAQADMLMAPDQARVGGQELFIFSPRPSRVINNRELEGAHWGSRVSEPEVKFIFLVLFFLGGLSTTAKSEAVLPAYLVGLVIAGVFVRDKVLVQRMRSIAFTMLNPFFIKDGTFVSLSALLAGLGLIMVLLSVKIATKFVGVWPLTRFFRLSTRESHYTTLLMSTGLTFGSISALYGLTNDIIDQRQYTILVTVVVGSAFVPTIIAQTRFQPEQTLGVATDSTEVANTIDQDHKDPLETADSELVGGPKAAVEQGRDDRAN